MIQSLLLPLNGLLCAVICLRIIFYQREPGARHHTGVSWLAYALAVCSGSVALRIALGVYELPIDWAEFGVNAVLCASVLSVKGNLARLFRPSRPLHKMLRPRSMKNWRYKW